jgi:hypothetical protein
MSADQISGEKRKASDVDLDSEDIRFLRQKLKPIVTARPRRPACNQRFLDIKADKPADDEAAVDLVLPTEQVDGGVGLNGDVGVDANNLTDDDEGCKTPKSEEHRIPKILICPPAPRKPRPTFARRKTESAAKLRRALFVNPSELNLLFGLQPKKF